MISYEIGLEEGNKLFVIEDRIGWIKIVFLLLVMVFIMCTGYYAFLLYKYQLSIIKKII